MLTKRMMIQALNRRAKGQAPGIDPKQLKKPYKEYWQAMDNAAKGKEYEALASIASEDDLKQITSNIKPVHYASLAEEKENIKPPKYDWQDYILKGHINLLGGYPGVGKTLFLTNFAKDKIHSKTFPDGSPNSNPGGNVLYIDGENFKDGILQHAKSNGMDLRRFFVRSVETDDASLNLCNPKYQDDIVERVHNLKPTLVIADSLSSFSLKGDKDVEEMGLILSFLDKVAQEFDVPLILAHHPRKRIFNFGNIASRLELDDFRGSGLIGAKARVALGISIVQTSEQEDKQGPRVLYVIKNNLGKYPEIGFSIFNNPTGGVKLIFSEPAKPYHKPDKAEIVSSWLAELLQEEKEMEPKQIFILGKDEDYSESDIRRARKNYLSEKIIDTRPNKHSNENRWKWNIKPQTKIKK